VENESKPIVLSGDAAGNLIVRSPVGEAKILPTGINSPIIKILVKKLGKLRVILVFGRADPEQIPTAERSKSPGIEEQKSKIAEALEFPIELVYLGDKPTDDLSCAIAVDSEIYTCNGNTVKAWGWDFNDRKKLVSRPEDGFTAHIGAVTAIAISPSAPILATGSSDGRIRVWLKNGALLAELAGDPQRPITGLGFIQDGQQLLSSTWSGTQAWDLEDLAAQLKQRPHGKVEDLRQQNWVRFFDDNNAAYETDRLASLLNENDKLEWKSEGPFVLTEIPTGLRLLDTRSSKLRDLALAAQPRLDESGNIASEDKGKISNGSGNTICVLHGSNRKNGSRRFYAINLESGEVLVEQPFLEDSIESVAFQSVANDKICWALNKQSIFAMSVKDRSVRDFHLSDKNAGRIKGLIPVNGANRGILLTSTESSSSSIMLVQFDRENDIADQRRSKANAPISGATVLASTRIQGSVTEIAVSGDGNRIAISIKAPGPAFQGVSEVRLLDENLKVIQSLSGSPDDFLDLHLNHDGTILRARVFWGLIYALAYEPSGYDSSMRWVTGE
jgi:WD40 repeat protein